MAGKLWIGLAFALGTAVATNLAFLWKHRGAVAAPAVDMRNPVTSAVQLFRSKWWAIGWAVAVLGWTFHVGALAFAPLSLAQAVISGGFVILAVLGERLFGFRLGRRQWLGIGLVALGLGFLGATTTAATKETRYSVIAIAIFQGVLLTVGLLLVLISTLMARHRHSSVETPPAVGRPDPDHPVTGGPPQAPVTAHQSDPRGSRSAGLLLGAAAGIAFGISDMSIKALAQHTLANAYAIISPWAGTAVVASLGAFYASARSLQIGEGLSVITVTSAASNITAITAGIAVFGEPLGNTVPVATLRILAFTLVVAGAMLMPGPLRAAEAGAREERTKGPRRRGRRIRTGGQQLPPRRGSGERRVRA